MAFFVPRSITCALENNKLDFQKGRKYKCICDYHMKPNGFEFTQGKIYECSKNYYLPCNNGYQISQFCLIGAERMFKELKE